MNCIIPGANLKIMNKVLQTLAKIGDELYIEAKNDRFQLATINQNKTAFCKFNFDSTFFTNFTIENPGDPVTCKVYMKSLFNVFKSKGPKEKKVDLCKINLDEEASKIIVKLKYKHDVTIVHNLRLIDKELIDVNYDLVGLSNEISATGTFVQQILNNFQNSDEDMSLEIKENSMVIRNYDQNSPSNKGIRSQIVLRSTEFQHYTIKSNSNITMSFKPFRAAAHFCEGFNLNMILNFDSGGKPVILTVRNPTFEANFVLSTINPNSCDTQSCVGLTRPCDKQTDLTIQDQEAMENINWDSDFEMNDVINQKEDGVIPNSPESPRTKRVKLVFGRCFEATFKQDLVNLGTMLASDSDPE